MMLLSVCNGDLKMEIGQFHSPVEFLDEGRDVFTELGSVWRKSDSR
jgi:hypothetical protein